MAKLKTPRTTWDQLAIDKLASSGLTLDDAKLLRIEYLNAEQTHEEHSSFSALPSLKFNYIDPHTGEPSRCAPGRPVFARYRYLKNDPNDIAAAAKGKPRRYTNAPGVGVCAYFPTSIDWKAVLADPRKHIHITEGELKAACACKHGFPTIGIGGVSNYRSGKDDLMLIPDLAKINWSGRRVFTIFDSDYDQNPAVCAAMNGLAEQLYQRGALPYFVPLPDVVQGGKTGLDDFLVTERGVNPLGDLIEQRAESLTISRELWTLNEQVIYVQDPGIVLVRDTNQKMAASAFTGHAFSNVIVPERVVRPDGSMSLKAVSAADKWMSWPMRDSIGRVTYAPGKEQQLINGSVRTSEWNMWPGWGAEPKKGDHAPFLKLLGHLFAGADPEDLKWFIQWLAYPLQHPGTKLFTAAALVGRHHGTGKSMVGYIMGQIYGKNFTQIKQADMEGTFTEWCENKQFVMVDDITGTDKRHVADAFKSMITQKEVRINIKFVPSFSVPDCLNFLLTSNQLDAIFLEDDDRRFFIHEVKSAPLDDAFYMMLDKRMKDGTIAAAVFHHLLRVDLSDFNPNARARKTLAKELMTADVKSDVGSWVAKLIADPDGTLRTGNVRIDGDLFSNRELLNIYDPTSRTQTTANSLGRELRRAGVQYYRDGKTVKTIKGTDRYYIVRNVEKWTKAKLETAVHHLDSRYRIGGAK